MTTGEAILAERKKLGWSQEKLADSLNSSRPTISLWESDKCLPDTTKILAMCKIFNCTADKLLNPTQPLPAQKTEQGSEKVTA